MSETSGEERRIQRVQQGGQELLCAAQREREVIARTVEEESRRLQRLIAKNGFDQETAFACRHAVRAILYEAGALGAALQTQLECLQSYFLPIRGKK